MCTLEVYVVRRVGIVVVVVVVDEVGSDKRRREY